MVVVTVAAAPRVCHVGRRRPPTRSHGHRQDGDFLGRPRLQRRIVLPVVVVEVDPVAARTAHRYVHAASPAASRRIGIIKAARRGGSRLDSCCFLKPSESERGRGMGGGGNEKRK